MIFPRNLILCPNCSHACKPAHPSLQTLSNPPFELKYPLLEILTLISHLKNSCNLLMLNPYSILQNVIGICRKGIGGIIMFFPAEKLCFMVVTPTSPVFFIVHEGKNRGPLRQNEKSY